MIWDSFSVNVRRHSAYDMVRLGYPWVTDCSLLAFLAWRTCWDLIYPCCHCDSHFGDARRSDCHWYPSILRLPDCVSHSSWNFEACAFGCCNDGIGHLQVNVFSCYDKFPRQLQIYWLYPLTLIFSLALSSPSPRWITDDAVQLTRV
jgi:hypothetical protein